MIDTKRQALLLALALGLPLGCPAALTLDAGEIGLDMGSPGAFDHGAEAPLTPMDPPMQAPPSGNLWDTVLQPRFETGDHFGNPIDTGPTRNSFDPNPLDWSSQGLGPGLDHSSAQSWVEPSPSWIQPMGFRQPATQVFASPSWGALPLDLSPSQQSTRQLLGDGILGLDSAEREGQRPGLVSSWTRNQFLQDASAGPIDPEQVVRQQIVQPIGDYFDHIWRLGSGDYQREALGINWAAGKLYNLPSTVRSEYYAAQDRVKGILGMRERAGPGDIEILAKAIANPPADWGELEYKIAQFRLAELQRRAAGKLWQDAVNTFKRDEGKIVKWASRMKYHEESYKNLLRFQANMEYRDTQKALMEQYQRQMEALFPELLLSMGGDFR